MAKMTSSTMCRVHYFRRRLSTLPMMRDRFDGLGALAQPRLARRTKPTTWKPQCLWKEMTLSSLWARSPVPTTRMRRRFFCRMRNWLSTKFGRQFLRQQQRGNDDPESHYGQLVAILLRDRAGVLDEVQGAGFCRHERGGERDQGERRGLDGGQQYLEVILQAQAFVQARPPHREDYQDGGGDDEEQLVTRRRILVEGRIGAGDKLKRQRHGGQCHQHVEDYRPGTIDYGSLLEHLSSGKLTSGPSVALVPVSSPSCGPAAW